MLWNIYIILSRCHFKKGDDKLTSWRSGLFVTRVVPWLRFVLLGFVWLHTTKEPHKSPNRTGTNSSHTCLLSRVSGASLLSELQNELDDSGKFNLLTFSQWAAFSSMLRNVKWIHNKTNKQRECSGVWSRRRPPGLCRAPTARSERVEVKLSEMKGNDSRRFRKFCILMGHYAAWSAWLKEKDTFNYEL